MLRWPGWRRQHAVGCRLEHNKRLLQRQLLAELPSFAREQIWAQLLQRGVRQGRGKRFSFVWRRHVAGRQGR